jgi:hypothetical protein
VSVTPNAATYAVSVTRAGAGSGTVHVDAGRHRLRADLLRAFRDGILGRAQRHARGGLVIRRMERRLHRHGACNVTMDAAKSVTATFTVTAKHVLSVTMQGMGSGTVTSAPAGIACFAACSASFQEAASVSLTPAAKAGSSFKGWGGACTGRVLVT